MSDVVDVVVDLETLGKRADAAIVAIGAVAFSPAGVSVDREPFYCRVRLESAMAWGGTVDGATIRWWLSQGDEARAEVSRDGGALDLPDALVRLSVWLPPKLNLWGNGPAFDNVILRSAFERADLKAWHYGADRCYRTIKAAFGHLAPVPELAGNVKHRADHDAARQAGHLVAIHHELAKVGVKLL